MAILHMNFYYLTFNMLTQHHELNYSSINILKTCLNILHKFLLNLIIDESSTYKNLNDINTSSYATFKDLDVNLYYQIIKKDTRFCEDINSNLDETAQINNQKDQEYLSNEENITEQCKSNVTNLFFLIILICIISSKTHYCNSN